MEMCWLNFIDFSLQSPIAKRREATRAQSSLRSSKCSSLAFSPWTAIPPRPHGRRPARRCPKSTNNSIG